LRTAAGERGTEHREALFGFDQRDMVAHRPSILLLPCLVKIRGTCCFPLPRIRLRMDSIHARTGH
jgi:hypothetical protein